MKGKYKIRMSSEDKPKSVDMVTSDNNNLHVVFMPFVALSHMIPLVLIARLFAARGVCSTIITTIHNALVFQKSIDEDIARGYPIVVRTLEFPASEVGLPIGAENPSATTSHESVLLGVEMLKTPMEQLIRDLAPNCIISDMFFPWTAALADELKIPRLVFYPHALFNSCVEHSLKVHVPHANVTSESESFVVPNLPHKITLKRSQVSHRPKPDSKIHEFGKIIQQSEKQSYGLVFNTFYELEPAYADHIKKVKDTKIWHLGPVFQIFNNADTAETTARHSCLSWLDKQKPNSVIYVCFGTLANFQEAQITEIALALEECKQPFVWVLRKKPGDEGLGGIPEGFVERIEKEGKGLVITDWAPQVKILEHSAVGWFLNHCGWNSVLEAVVAGVPLLTWPLFSDQFNHEYLVHLLGIGVGIGADVGNASIDITSPVIKKQQIVEAIGKLSTISAESMRSNLKELTMKAKQAVQEGGSSFNSLTELIEDIKAFKSGPN